jgi:hypothetical protein
MNSWRSTTNIKFATLTTRDKSCSKHSMNFGAQFKSATLRQVHIERSRPGSTTEWSGLNERARDRFGMLWLCNLNLTVTEMEEGRKRVLGIMASILVSRHLRTTEDLHDSRPSPRTEALVGSAVQWAERIMRRIDGQFGGSSDTRRDSRV